jgi:opacity protein-like surface antigen
MQLNSTITLILLTTIPLAIQAAVLPEDRADVLIHAYTGGGVEVIGPSVLIRKSLGNSLSASVNYYEDSITSASIDVEMITGASTYTENRKEHSFTVDYLHDSTIFSLGYNDSKESDYTSKTTSFGISQEMFSAMTTVTLSYAQAADVVMDNTRPDFKESVDRRIYRLGISQVMSANSILGITWETITDQGHLNNPYRRVRYVDDSVERGYSLQSEVYPSTRNSSTIAIRGIYYLPYRASLSAGYRYFADSWGIDASNAEISYVHPLGDTEWVFDIKYRFYQQSAATFYSDLYPTIDYQNHLARDKELSTFNSHTVGLGVSYEFLQQSWSILDRGSINLSYDYIMFRYDDFHDATAEGGAGEEPLYEFSANVYRLYLSVWY